jgi:hypothetical protein
MSLTSASSTSLTAQLGPELQDAIRKIARMTHHWFRTYAGRYGFPDNYTTIDIETDGLQPDVDTICTFGYTKVRDRVPVETVEWALNWPDCALIDREHFRQKLANVQFQMERQGKRFHHTWEFLQTGRPPLEVIQNIYDLVEDCYNRGELLVAQNGYKFDVELMQAHFHNWLRLQYIFDENALYDTGIAEKASQLNDSDDPLPRAGESMKAWAWRVGDIRRRGVRWALDGHCEERYELTKRAGMDPLNHHRSGHDSLLLHHLFECHRKLAEEHA